MKERVLDQARIREFEVNLIREEKSTATCEKYLRDVKCFAQFVGEQSVTKETVLAWEKRIGGPWLCSSLGQFYAGIH